MYIHPPMPRATKNTALTMMPISPPMGRPLRAGAFVASIYFSEKTWSVIKVRPDTVGVDAGINGVAAFE
jgi:hypothetical protein